MDNTIKQQPQRIVSVDALRGFDMFWIIGGEAVAKALEKISDGPVVSAFATQLQHAEWEGFHFFDGIFPLFLFLVGVSIVLSMDRTVAKVGRKGALVRIVRRSLLLFVVGVFYYGGLSQKWPDVALSGVLPRIAWCYLVAATLYVLMPRRGIVVAACVFLAGYWGMMMFVPFPDVNLKHGTLGKKGSQADARAPAELFGTSSAMVSGTLEEGRNLAHYVDACWLPGRKRNLYYTNEGLLSTMPALVNTLFGIMAGWLLVSTRWTGAQKAAWLVAAGAGGIVLGLLWGLEFPVIKRLWTSSFVLLSSGFSAVMLGVFYLVIDVWRWQKWCLPFLWIGTNALTAYLVENVVDVSGVAARFVGGDVASVLGAYGPLLTALVALLLPILLVRFLYQNKLFIRL